MIRVIHVVKHKCDDGIDDRRTLPWNSDGFRKPLDELLCIRFDILQELCRCRHVFIGVYVLQLSRRINKVLIKGKG